MSELGKDAEATPKISRRNILEKAVKASAAVGATAFVGNEVLKGER
jgi:hypothetical protein